MIKYVLDLSVVSEPLKSRPSQGVMRRLHEHEGEIAIPALVWHELRLGSLRLTHLRQREVIERYIQDVVLTSFPVLEYDQKAADWHAGERARLATLGLAPSFITGQIAAIAFVNRMVLVTLNPTDFRAFKELQVRNWS
ncbi:MAG: type II toxin-antitoxin system VapC family toxin [Gammaproteobacteria bacterium]|nr:type II toxin-antitoxin system VapC family toxin [Gammaproteobacteria bacterium]